MSISLSNLKALRRWPEALELAVSFHPHEVEGILQNAGDAFLVRGEYKKLYDLLESLPEPLKCLPETLFWRFRTAYRLRREEPLITQVRELLQSDEAANLRAFYASHYLNNPEKLCEIQRAKVVRSSYFVRHLYALAVADENMGEAIKELELICKEAKETGNHFDYQQSKNLLGYLFGHLGQFKTSLNCFLDVMEVINQNRQTDWQLYLTTCNNLLYNQILVNDLAYAQEWAEVLSANLDNMQTDIAFNARATLGDFYLAAGDLDKALTYHQANFEERLKISVTKNLMTGSLFLNYFKILLRIGQRNLAFDLLAKHQKSPVTSQVDYLIAEAAFKLAQGQMDWLEQLESINYEALSADVRTVCLTLLAHVYFQQGKGGRVNELQLKYPITDLSLEGFRILLGNNDFDHVYNYWKGNDLLPIISDPRLFDELANDESSWHRLKLLQHFPGHIEQCRYAQYLFSQNEFKSALEVINRVLAERQDILAQSIQMSLLLALGNFQAFEKLLDMEISDENSLLNAEGRLRMYEAIAGYLYTNRGEARLAQKYLHFEQALAFELRLGRRKKIIAMLLEEVNAALGEVTILEPINLKGLKSTLQKQVRQRFDSLLGEGNIDAAKNLYQIGYISFEEVKLVEALKAYREAEQGLGSFNAIARILANHKPENVEAKLYCYLLLLQLYSKIGKVNDQTDLNLILKGLDQCAKELTNFPLLLPVAARIFPLGLALAAYLLVAFEPASKHVYILIDDSKKNGIYKGGDRLASLPPLIRNALIVDGINAQNKAFQEAISSKTGFTINKVRFEKSLEKAGLTDFEFTNIGALYRGLRQVEQDGYLTEGAMQFLQVNQHLKGLVLNL